MSAYIAEFDVGTGQHAHLQLPPDLLYGIQVRTLGGKVLQSHLAAQRLYSVQDHPRPVLGRPIQHPQQLFTPLARVLQECRELLSIELGMPLKVAHTLGGYDAKDYSLGVASRVGVDGPVILECVRLFRARASTTATV